MDGGGQTPLLGFFWLKNDVRGYTNMCSYEFMCNGYIMGHRKRHYIDLIERFSTVPCQEVFS